MLCRLQRSKHCFFVHTPNGEVTAIHLDQPCRLSQLKTIIESQTGIPPVKQLLYSAGHRVHNDCSLHTLPEDTNIHLLFWLVGGGKEICNASKTEDTPGHSDEQESATYKCKHHGCEKSFRHRSSLSRHSLTHQAEDDRRNGVCCTYTPCKMTYVHIV